MIGLSFETSFTVQLIFISQKLEQVLKSKKVQPLLINQQCMVNSLSFHLSYVDYAGYTAQHIHQCIFTHKNSAIGEQLFEVHGSLCYLNENKLWILCNWRTMFKCLVYDMLFTNERNPCLKTMTEAPCLRIFSHIYLSMLLVKYYTSQLN